MLPSEIPKLPTDPPVRGFPGVWNLLLLHDSLLRMGLHPWLFSLYFGLLYFVLPPFKENRLPFWVPGVLQQCSEVVLWKLFSIQMIFWWICGGESGVSVLFLHHLRIASTILFTMWKFNFFFPPSLHICLNLTLVFLLCSVYVLSIFALVSHCLINVLVCIYSGTSHLFFLSHLRNVFDDIYIMCDICCSFLKLTGYFPGFSSIS